jgi:hypothetical protein
LASILPHDRGGRFQPNTNSAALIDKGTLGGNAPNDIHGGQYRRHLATLAEVRRVLLATAALNPHSPDGTMFCGAMGLIMV